MKHQWKSCSTFFRLFSMILHMDTYIYIYIDDVLLSWVHRRFSFFSLVFLSFFLQFLFAYSKYQWLRSSFWLLVVYTCLFIIVMGFHSWQTTRECGLSGNLHTHSQVSWTTWSDKCYSLSFFCICIACSRCRFYPL